MRALPRLISPAAHFVEDSVIAAALLLAPMFLALGPVAGRLSLAGGVFLALYNGLTDRPGSLWPLLTETHHRILDTAGVVGLLAVPWLFSGIDRWFFAALGISSLLLNLVTDFTPEPRPARPLGRRLLRWAVTTAGAGAAVALALAAVQALQSSGSSL